MKEMEKFGEHLDEGPSELNIVETSESASVSIVEVRNDSTEVVPSSSGDQSSDTVFDAEPFSDDALIAPVDNLAIKASSADDEDDDRSAEFARRKELPKMLPGVGLACFLSGVIVLIWVANLLFGRALPPVFNLALALSIYGTLFVHMWCSHRTLKVAEKLFKSEALSPSKPLIAFFSIPVIAYIGLSSQSDFIIIVTTLINCFFIARLLFWPFKVAKHALTGIAKAKGRGWSLGDWLSCTAATVLVATPPMISFVLLIMAAIFGRVMPHDLLPWIVLFVSLGWFTFAPLGFIYTNRLLKRASLLPVPEPEKKTKGLSGMDGKGDILITYRPVASWERWLQQRMQDRSWRKLIYLLAMLAIVLVTGLPEIVLKLMIASGGALGIIGAPGATDANVVNAQTLLTLSIIQWLIVGGMVAAVVAYVLKPTNISLSAKGIKFLWRHGPLSVDGELVKWQDITNIALSQKEGTTSSDQNIDFHSSKAKPLSIKLGSIMSIDDRERILKAIESWAPGVERDPQILHLLEPPADYSYTELWLQALTAPPKRERFKPLADGASLRDGQFKVIRQLGVGGQGTAYLTDDIMSKEAVVLKEFILPVFVAVGVRRQALERFENEARILKQLDHPQIVKLVDFFVEDHRSYLVLEHIDGKSLKEIVLEEGAMSEERVKGLAQQMCSILEYLHGLEPPCVHRDFTPDNLILRKDGTLKLVDFNVAQQTESTATGTVVGKHAYLPPEQFRGEPCPQSDIYAFGSTLHFLLTGHDPEPISVSRPKEQVEAISENMNFLVATATSMSLEERFNDIEKLKEVLDAI